MRTAPSNSMPTSTQMLSSKAEKAQGSAHPFFMHIGLPAAVTYCATTVASCLSKQFLMETVADPEVIAPAPLLQTHAAPLVDGQATCVGPPLAGAFAHVQPAVLSLAPTLSQVTAWAPVRRQPVSLLHTVPAHFPLCAWSVSRATRSTHLTTSAAQAARRPPSVLLHLAAQRPVPPAAPAAPLLSPCGSLPPCCCGAGG